MNDTQVKVYNWLHEFKDPSTGKWTLSNRYDSVEDAKSVYQGLEYRIAPYEPIETVHKVRDGKEVGGK